MIVILNGGFARFLCVACVEPYVRFINTINRKSLNAKRE
jgi:hypothetical protein